MKCGECKYSTLRIEVERAREREWPRHTGVIVRKAEILECGRKEKIEKQRKTISEISKKGG